MNPYNQQTVNMPDLQNAMLQHQDQQRKLAAANQLAQGGNGWGGIGEILGAALGAYKSNKLAGEADQTGMQINDQLSQLQAQQEAEIQRIAEEKAEREYRRKMADEKAKWEREHGGKVALKQMEFDNREPSKASFNERLFGQMSPEQRESYINNMAGIKQAGGTIFNPTEQALIQQGAVTPDQLIEKKKNDVLGVKPEKALSDGTNQKISFLKNSLEKLGQYKKEAFKDGDYQEIGSFFGNTNNLLKEAVRNKLRSESGAAISDEELASELDLFSPSMARSDETNMARINELEATLKRLIEEQGGTLGEQQQKPQGNGLLDQAGAALQELGIDL